MHLPPSSAVGPCATHAQWDVQHHKQHGPSSHWLVKVRLDTMVTVVDASSFLADYSTRAPVAARPDLGDGGSLRPVVDLLVEQLECALFIIATKCSTLLM